MIFYNIAQIVDAEQQRCVTDIEHTMIKYLKSNYGKTTAEVKQYQFIITRKNFPNRNLQSDVYVLALQDEEGNQLYHWLCEGTSTTAIVLASFWEKLQVASYYESIRLGMSAPKIVGYIHRGEYVDTQWADS